MLALVLPLLLPQASRSFEQLYAARLEERRVDLIELRRDLHRHPELSGEEVRTAGIVAARLRALGFEVRTGVGGHGVVAHLVGAKAGAVVAFRADMDAVLSDARDPVEFRSLDPTKRHICGHDLHTTIGLALAEGFAAARAEQPGTLVLYFQPAEENATGARAMVSDGALTEPRPAALFALHCAPFEVGEFASAERVLMAGRDRLVLRLSGPGATPEWTAALLEDVRALSTVEPQRALGSVPPEAVLVEAALQRTPTGDTSLILQLSSGSRAARADVRAALDELTSDELWPGVDFAGSWSERLVPGVENDVALERAARAVLERELGPGRVHLLTGVVPAFSEDFGFFQDEVPGVMFFLGVANTARGQAGMPHSPDFVADEEALFVGARAMAAVLLATARSSVPTTRER